MKDTVSDMRKHMWPENAASGPDAQDKLAEKTEEKIEAFRAEMANEVARLIERQRQSDGKLEATKEELQQLVEKAISGSIEVERGVQEENIKDAILDTVHGISKIRRNVTPEDILDKLEKMYDGQSIVRSIRRMVKEGDLDIKNYQHGYDEGVGPDTIIEITPQGRQTLAKKFADPKS